VAATTEQGALVPGTRLPEQHVRARNLFRDAANRIHDDAVKYNEIALRVMKKHEVRIDDLHAFCEQPSVKEKQLPENVHFTDAGYAALGEEVAKQIEAALAK